METCTVCVEAYSAKAPKYTCDACGYEACRTCVLRYVEGSDHEPKCMGCGNMWSRKFLFETMSHAVYKRMVNQSAVVEVQRQKSMLASTVPYVEMARERDVAQNKVRDLEARIAELSIQARNWRGIAENLQSNMQHFARGQLTTASSKPTRTFLCRCSKSSENDECRGFVDSETHMCVVCETKHCKRCLEELGAEHECDENVVENVKALRSTCKACPKCFAPIQKIHGCNDMFCVACATAFCWRTMKIHENGNSNPHYYQWLRDSGDPSSSRVRITNGRMFDREYMRSDKYKALCYRDREKIANILQKLSHQRHMITTLTERHNAQGRQVKSTIERAAYLRKVIDDKEFNQRIKRIQTDAEHAEMIGATLALLEQARNTIVEPRPTDTVESITKEVVNIIREYNTQHDNISKIFSRKPFARLTLIV